MCASPAARDSARAAADANRVLAERVDDLQAQLDLATRALQLAQSELDVMGEERADSVSATHPQPVFDPRVRGGENIHS